MEQSTKKKIFHLCMIVLLIVAIFAVVAILKMRYQVEGETNPPFEISKISVISSTDGANKEDAANKWNIDVNQNNDIYIYLNKNNNYGKTEIIDNVVINNITINKTSDKYKTQIYKPASDGTAMFNNADANIADQITYTGDTESNIKNLKISNQGGLIVFRIANNNVGNYVSNDAPEVDYTNLLKELKVNEDDLKANVSFDLTINLNSGKTYKANINLDIPVNGVVENGTSSTEITDLSSIVIKREAENN